MDSGCPEQFTRRRFLAATGGLGAVAALPGALPASAAPLASGTVPTLRLAATDAGPVLRHGDGPDGCDVYGARDVWVYQDGGQLYLNYDGAGETGWLASLATSDDGVRWTKRGAVLQLGAPGSDDSGSASYGTTYQAGTGDWHMFYLGTPNTSPAPDRIPAFPYLTLKAHGEGPSGPWTKQPDVVPFRPQPDTFYSVTASPGQIISHGGEYLQFFSAATQNQQGTQRTIGIARTTDLNGAWQLDPNPIVPATEQIENSSLYYEPADDMWFLFTNHVTLDSLGEYTDAIWVYWTRDLNSWSTENKAIVLDRTNCAWSPYVVGLPSVLPIGGRLAVFYDGRPAADVSHMGRDVGLAWLDLPLHPPAIEAISRSSVVAH